ncbi:MAG: hypothetical protein R6W77_09735 [Trueperaceae bacterium]
MLALEALRPGRAETFNLGTGRGYSVCEVIAACARVTGKDIPTRLAPRRAGDPPRLVADGARARSELGWEPAHAELDDIVASAWGWLQLRPEGYES